MKRVGFIGWRGMVGSVLLSRMREEGDFEHILPVFASTSQAGERGPDVGQELPPLLDAFDLQALSSLDIIVTCQGSEYTKQVYPDLRGAGWSGYWLDASSAKRMDADSVIIIDPVNRAVIDEGLRLGIKNFIGGNCTVSLMLMAMSGLFRADLVEWITVMTYQAASGAGAQSLRELVLQIAALGAAAQPLLSDWGRSILEIDARVSSALHSAELPTANFGAPLAASLLPWIDSAMPNGQTREEWKGRAETNKILGTAKAIPVDGICVRVGAMRCHSQAMTIKLNKAVSLKEIENIIAGANEWVRLVPNTREDTLKRLTPAAVAGKLDIHVGRLRKLDLDAEYLTAFTVGDQLLWGAAEPIRRMLRILTNFL